MIEFAKNNKISLVTILVISVIPLVIRSDTSLSLITEMGIAVVFALSYNMLLGQCGLLSFGHAVFFGMGGYLTIHAISVANNDIVSVPTVLVPLVGALVGLILGLIVGWISTRRAGVTFAMITMGINELLATSVLMFYDFFGSEQGISAMREECLGFSFGSQSEVYYLIFFWAVICVFAMYFFTKTPLGQISNAVRDNPERASFIGYNPVRVRFFNVAFAGLFAGLAGGLHALNWEIICYESISIMQSSYVLFMVFIGGSAYFFGPIIGAVLVTFFIYQVSVFTEAWMIYLGIIFMVMVLFAPQGIAGILMLHKPLWINHMIKRLVPAYLFSIISLLLLVILPCIAIIEVIYKLSSTQYSESIVSLLGISFDAFSFSFWVIMLSVIVLGVFLLIWSFGLVRDKWDLLSKEIKNEAHA